MSTIIAGHFELQDEVDVARRALAEAGFSQERISAFYLSQAGQHDMTPIGGDNLHSPGAKETPTGVVQGAATGGAIGAAVGTATVPLTGPAGPIVGGLVGAHVGSLFSFSKMKEAASTKRAGAPLSSSARRACWWPSPLTMPATRGAPSKCCASWVRCRSNGRAGTSWMETGPISTHRSRRILCTEPSPSVHRALTRESANLFSGAPQARRSVYAFDPAQCLREPRS